MVLYVALRCTGAKYFGAIKLNKIIWKADFDSYAARGIPITGREYRRRYFGPALLEMLPVHKDMLRDGLIEMSLRDYGDGMVERRTVALSKPDLRFFTPDDLAYVEAAIRYYWDKTGTESSDDSHGAAWRTRRDGDPMPYELAFLSDEPLDLPQLMHVEELIYNRGWTSE
jgi:Antitoxin SocA-like, Panacea domain